MQEVNVDRTRLINEVLGKNEKQIILFLMYILHIKMKSDFFPREIEERFRSTSWSFKLINQAS